MNGKTIEYLKLAAPAIMAFITVYAANPIYFQYLAALLLLPFLLVYISFMLLQRKNGLDARNYSLSSFFYRLDKEINEKGRSMLDALSGIEKMPEAEIAGFAKDMRMKMQLGYSPAGYETNPSASGELHNELEERREIASENSVGSFQRRMVGNMVFSTILPSVSLFGFIGYSLFSYSPYIIPAFSVVLCSVFPALSMITSLRMSDIGG